MRSTAQDEPGRRPSRPLKRHAPLLADWHRDRLFDAWHVGSEDGRAWTCGDDVRTDAVTLVVGVAPDGRVAHAEGAPKARRRDTVAADGVDDAPGSD